MTAPTYTGLARAVDGIPVVPTSAARNARYTSPPTDFRVHNLETGSIERWTGTAWKPLGPFSTIVYVSDHGGVFDGVADDTAAVQAAIDRAFLLGNGKGGLVQVDSGLVRLTSVLALKAGVTVAGCGMYATTFKKDHTGDWMTCSAAGCGLRDFQVDGMGATRAGGRGLVMTAASLTANVGFRCNNVLIINTDDEALYIGPDAAYQSVWVGSSFVQYHNTPGAEQDSILVAGPDTAGTFRQFFGGNHGVIHLIGALDLMLIGASLRNIVTDATSLCQLVFMAGCRIATTGGATTINLTSSSIVGCSFAGDVTLSSLCGYLTFVGNVNTSGTFTNNLTGGLATSTIIHKNPAGNLDITGATYLPGEMTLGTLKSAVNGVGTLGTTGQRFLAAYLGATGLISTGPVTSSRYVGTGTAHVAGDYAAHANWGTAPTITPLARDTGGRVSVLAQATTGANPTLTLTFKDGTWTTAPSISYGRGDALATAGRWSLTSISSTAAVFTFVGTPVAGETYILDFVVTGK